MLRDFNFDVTKVDLGSFEGEVGDIETFFEKLHNVAVYRWCKQDTRGSKSASLLDCLLRITGFDKWPLTTEWVRIGCCFPCVS